MTASASPPVSSAAGNGRAESGPPHTTAPPNYGSITPQTSTDSPNNHDLTPPSRREKITTFVMENRGLFFLALAQLFGGVMNLATRFLATSLPEGRQYHTLQILFVRMAATMVISYSWMWWNTVPDMPLGKREVRGLLVARGCSGFVGVFGLYCRFFLFYNSFICFGFLVLTRKFCRFTFIPTTSRCDSHHFPRPHSLVVRLFNYTQHKRAFHHAGEDWWCHFPHWCHPDCPPYNHF